MSPERTDLGIKINKFFNNVKKLITNKNDEQSKHSGYSYPLQPKPGMAIDGMDAEANNTHGK